MRQPLWAYVAMRQLGITVTIVGMCMLAGGLFLSTEYVAATNTLIAVSVLMHALGRK